MHRKNIVAQRAKMSIVRPFSNTAAWGLLFIGCGILLLRLVIWKFFRGADMMVKEDLSNMIVSLTQGAFTCWGLVWALRGRLSVKSTGLEWPILILGGISVASLFYTADFSISLRALLPFIASIGFFGVLTMVLDDERRLQFFLYFMLALALVTAAFGIQELFFLFSRSTAQDAVVEEANRSLYYILSRRRVTSFIGWPNSLAGYLLLTLPFAGAVIALVRPLFLRCLAGGCLLVLLGGFLATFSFLGWASLLIAGVCVAPEIYSRLAPHSGPRIKWVFYSLMFVFLALFAVVIARKDFLASMTPRLIYYQNAFALIGDHPVLGQGVGMFGIASRPLVQDMNGFTNYVHNTYLQWWVEGGILGLGGAVLFIVIFIVMARRIVQFYRQGPMGWTALAVVAGLGAFFIDNFFSFTFIKPNIAVHGWALLAVFVALYQRAKDVPQVSGARLGCLLWSSLGILVVNSACAVVILVGLLFYHAGFNAYRDNQIDKAGQMFAQGSLIDRWSFSYPASTGEAALRVYQVSHKDYHLRLAEVNYLEAVRREPLQYAPHFMLGRIYLALNEKDDARHHLREAQRLSPYEYSRDSSILKVEAKGLQELP